MALASVVLWIEFNLRQALCHLEKLKLRRAREAKLAVPV
jgi:hypothetical protein